MVLPESEKDVEALEPGHSTVFFRLIRKSTDGTLAGYYAVPARRTSDGVLKVGDDVMSEGTQSRAIDAVVVGKHLTWVMRAIKNFLYDSSLKKPVKKVVVPINARALLIKEAASVYADLAREITREHEGVLVMECFDFPKKISLDVIDELAILLYPFSPVYLARPDLGMTDFTVFANCNFQGVCADLRNKPWPADKVGVFLGEFSEKARARRLSTYVHGVGSESVSRAVNKAVIDFLDGSAI